MYLVGKGSDVMGPGTSMVQRIDWTRDQETQLRNSNRGPGLGCPCKNGLGLFDSGIDFTTWGPAEWAVVAVGAYAAFSLMGDTKRGYARTRRIGKAVRKAA